MSDSCPTADLTPHEARFAVLDSPVHGLGAFAMRPLATGERIVEYTGQRITKAESQVRCAAGNHFIFSLDDEWDLDGDQPDNPARFVNHSCEPNCELFYWEADPGTTEEERLWLQTIRPIQAGEELLIDYSWPADAAIPCRCGTATCRGWIVDPAERHLIEERKDG